MSEAYRGTEPLPLSDAHGPIPRVEPKGCTARDLETENRTLRLALIRCIAMHGPQHIEEHYYVLADPLRLTITTDERGGMTFDVVDRCGS